MASGDNILAGVKLGLRDERYYPHDDKWVECIHWRVGLHHVGRLLGSSAFLHNGKILLSIFSTPDYHDYYKEPRAATQRLPCVETYAFDELDPLAVVSIVEEWSKKEPFKVVEHPEAAMLSLPS